MSKTSFSRVVRSVSTLVGVALILAACGGSDSAAPEETRTRNAALGVSTVTLARPAVISAGDYHSLVLDDTGRMYGFGSNSDGQITSPQLAVGATRLTAIDGGYNYTLALDDKGKMYSFGLNFSDRTTVPALKVGATKFTAISAGGYHSLAIDDKGSLYGFGYGALGQTKAPTLKNGATKFTVISAGGAHSLAIDDKGQMYGFGYGAWGQATPPNLRNGGTKFTAIAAGATHSVALDDKGNLYGFGYWYGDTWREPTLKEGASKFTAIASGDYHSLALDDLGNMYVFGVNTIDQTIPTSSKGTITFTTITAGGFHSLAIDDKGNLYAFGRSQEGQTVIPPVFSSSYLRTMPIAMGGTTAYGVDENEDVVEFNTDYKPWEDGDILSIAAGPRHALVITRSGFVLGFGDGTIGQLDFPDVRRPVQVIAGLSYSAALQADGTVVEWGAHTAPPGQLIEKPANLPRIIALASGLTHILGITESGTVVGWGDNTGGKATPPVGLKDVLAVAANARCSVALSRNGALTWWGSCSDELTAKTSIPGASTIALTDLTAAALVSGSIVTWGADANDLLAPPEGSDFVAMSAGTAAVLVVDSKGTVSSWGDNWGDPFTIPEMFGGPAPILNDGICDDCVEYEPIVLTDEQVERDMAFYTQYLSPEQKDKAVKALGGSTDKPLSAADLQALIDAAKKEGRTEALATVKETIVAAAAPTPDPVTVTASTLPAAQSPVTKVNTTITTKQAITLLGLKKATKVAFVVPKKASVSACKITKTAVTTTGSGLCNVKVNYTNAKKKKTSTTLVLVVG